MTIGGGLRDESMLLGLATSRQASPEDIGVTQKYGCHAQKHIANQTSYTQFMKVVSYLSFRAGTSLVTFHIHFKFDCLAKTEIGGWI